MTSQEPKITLRVLGMFKKAQQPYIGADERQKAVLDLVLESAKAIPVDMLQQDLRQDARILVRTGHLRLVQVDGADALLPPASAHPRADLQKVL
jgi:hypothetical protein